MTAELTAFVDSSIAAERCGDAAAALEYHVGVPMFRRSAHRVALEQLAPLSAEMTPWMWARWAVYQATRAEDHGTGSAHLLHAALCRTVETFCIEDLTQAWEANDDPMRAIAQTLGEHWVFHQLCAFEAGGLQHFLDDLATGRLAEESALASSWVGCRMGGFRLEGLGPGVLTVEDLATGEAVEILDLGAGLHAPADGWLVGRLVPSGTAPGLMFDTRPLPVDEQTAREVATASSAGGWFEVLARAVAEGRVDRAVLLSEDRELVTDVASLSLLARGTRRSALTASLDRLARGCDEVGRAAYRILESVADGTFGPASDAPYVAAALVNVHAYAAAQRSLARPEAVEGWATWLPLVPEPARTRLRLLIELSRGSAAA